MEYRDTQKWIQRESGLRAPGSINKTQRNIILELHSPEFQNAFSGSANYSLELPLMIFIFYFLFYYFATHNELQAE